MLASETESAIVITPSELELVVDPVMLVSMLCTCEILNVMLVLTMLILEGVRVRVLRTEATDTLLSAQLCLDDRR